MIALTSGRSRGMKRVWFGVACPAPPNGQWRADRAWRRILTNIGKSPTGCSPAAGRRRASLRPPRARAASSGTRFSISRSSLLRRRDWRERTGCPACRSSRSARPSSSFDVSCRGCRRCRSRLSVTLSDICRLCGQPGFTGGRMSAMIPPPRRARFLTGPLRV